MRFLAVSGSLRAGSSNAALLGAAALLLPPGHALTHFGGIGALPAFNPDDDVEPAPPAVEAWRQALREADAVLISSPEYAHGVPGALKNALDWVVGSGELYLKPVGLLNPSPESQFAQPQLAEVLRTMTAVVAPEATITVRLPRRGATPEQAASDPDVARAVRAALA